jgi:hypothetical protein
VTQPFWIVRIEARRGLSAARTLYRKREEDKGLTEDIQAVYVWRRETGNIGTGKKYPAARTPRAVRVRTLKNFAGVSVPISTSVEN